MTTFSQKIQIIVEKCFIGKPTDKWDVASDINLTNIFRLGAEWGRDDIWLFDIFGIANTTWLMYHSAWRLEEVSAGVDELYTHLYNYWFQTSDINGANIFLIEVREKREYVWRGCNDSPAEIVIPNKTW